jgi:hypothetical protein
MRTSNTLKVISISASILLLAGCASGTAKPTSTPTQTQTATPTPTPTVTQTQAEIEAEFYKIAEDSCAKAQKENTVERFVNNSPEAIIALSKDNAYLDYSAIYIDNKGKAQVIYELELTACWPSYLISMMEEANQPNEGDYEHYVKKNADGTFTWTDKNYLEEGPALKDTIYVAEDGIFVKAIPEDVLNTRVLEYGPLSDDEMQTFKDAVDAEINRLNE